jgi:hypothetical protein
LGNHGKYKIISYSNIRKNPMSKMTELEEKCKKCGTYLIGLYETELVQVDEDSNGNAIGEERVTNYSEYCEKCDEYIS